MATGANIFTEPESCWLIISGDKAASSQFRLSVSLQNREVRGRVANVYCNDNVPAL